MGKEPRIAIVGGGAGGISAAIAAAEELLVRGAHADIHIYEASDKIGRPILASGNGRCNFSNSHIDMHQYRNADFAAACIRECDSMFEGMCAPVHLPNGVAAWFYSHGLMFAEEGEGRLYPKANKSSSVLDVLKALLEDMRVQIYIGSKVDTIDPVRNASNLVTMKMSDGSFARADKAIIACGGNVSPNLFCKAPISFVETTPILCPIEVDKAGKKECKSLENIRVKCSISVARNGNVVASERGEAMFRKYGISGICAFNLSRFICEGDTLCINLFPDMGQNELESQLLERLSLLEKTYGHRISVERFLVGMVLPRFASVLIERANLFAKDECGRREVIRLSKVAQSLDFTVLGPADIEHAQVRRGGFSVDAISPSTMELKEFPGIHIIGEALNVDGPCGGYNLNWAFASGILAGRAAAKGIC